MSKHSIVGDILSDTMFMATPCIAVCAPIVNHKTRQAEINRRVGDVKVKEKRGMKASLTCLTVSACLVLGGSAIAQSLTIYGSGGYVVDLIKQSNGTYVYPVLVAPYYGAIGSAFLLRIQPA
jgi:hypothetical protein